MNLVDAYVTKVISKEERVVEWSLEPQVIFKVEYDSWGSISTTELWFGAWGDVPDVKEGYKFTC
ncbi:hypothetical protein [Priestia megaterium]|uniref:hypothetical protein n=1 Tax=Priestia megaterium TaxID=1404 RepID=UPI00211BF1C8|nr:hypothetical protein [Priestia megaterium]